ncbi:MAG: Integral membrane protein [uncultured Thiotrichaceae bacterium]|uniref:Integral membrane protein n=1 Tax=uncultured Thiotrichaceae bacterium TaxID=298394 RepID=A0A6S6TQN0_9GAMM|nr:MAG: Integral membrane protein [uncultured Thiotrichaceae bacterium]
MDPVTQGVLGAIAAQGTSATKNLAKAAFIGAIAAMTPDLDVLIRSSADPLLNLEFHRQFTHSLFFIPIGGLLCSLILFPLLGKRWGFSFTQTLLWCMVGFATHGLLDGCTSYGTLLLWPLSDHRFSWDTISIIDPLFTLPLITFVIFAARRKKRAYVVSAIIWCVFYLSLGFVQHNRAIDLGKELAESRGHNPDRLEAKPSFGNLVVWKLIYEADGVFYVDAIKPGLTSPRIWQGTSIAKLDITRDLPWLDPNSQQANDIERFSWFSQAYIAIDPVNPLRVIDMRYSLLPNEIKPLWGITLSKDVTPTDYVAFSSERGDSRAALKTLWNMIFE